MSKKTLILGACGQIGTELTLALRSRCGSESVIASDIREGQQELMRSGPFVQLDATDKAAIREVLESNEISDVYLMAAMLSATAEKFPMKAWNLNMTSLFNVLNLAKDNKIEKIFWPSSIAVFGPTTPKSQTPQHTIMEPSTVYGISKQTGERWCEYYHKRYGVDVRSLRYPGLISYTTLPGGGTTDYAVDIYHKALKHKKFVCFLSAETTLPMMYMEDAILATAQIMDAENDKIKIRSAYNVAAFSFNPSDIAESIRKHIPEFEISYSPDFRQSIANSWPQSIDDISARKDWGWKHSHTLEQMTELMLSNLKERYQ